MATPLPLKSCQLQVPPTKRSNGMLNNSLSGQLNMAQADLLAKRACPSESNKIRPSRRASNTSCNKPFSDAIRMKMRRKSSPLKCSKRFSILSRVSRFMACKNGGGRKSEVQTQLAEAGSYLCTENVPFVKGATHNPTIHHQGRSSRMRQRMQGKFYRV